MDDRHSELEEYNFTPDPDTPFGCEFSGNAFHGDVLV
eukprot:CAMPEP_0201524944 /NCGR_PEP_ID=MMETSP0161_2-20130828/25952_1 /ASSEMBLY_ACC=CAM_ASM_000251 /TAXON_ID=180227 /ORGANISM="Neoparamoeba aestuarina, Strain SoJaBio B1-5/56/2" /LENGTH=36 /DNA_ID= /DNA_START= /DNA_END= /DNA_ORIENTATION=